jgi:multiple sugar transport system permease protein
MSVSSLTKRRRSLRGRVGWIAFAFLLPFMLLFVLFRAGPVLAAFGLSFTKYEVLTPPTWVGFKNYANILFGTEAATRLFWKSIVNTLYFTAGQITLELISGLLLAVLVNARLLRAKAAWRTFFYTPVVTSMVAASMLWLWLYNAQGGFLNAILKSMGSPGLQWLGSTTLAMPSVIIMAVWQGAGWSMVIYLAGLQGIPESLYEAARIDGASPTQQFWKVTLPLLAPVTLFIIIMSGISNLQVFSQVFVMTQGGPLNATTTVTYEIYLNAFRFLRMGYASAMSFLLALVILGVSILNNRIFGGNTIEY